MLPWHRSEMPPPSSCARAAAGRCRSADVSSASLVSEVSTEGHTDRRRHTGCARDRILHSGSEGRVEAIGDVVPPELNAPDLVLHSSPYIEQAVSWQFEVLVAGKEGQGRRTVGRASAGKS